MKLFNGRAIMQTNVANFCAKRNSIKERKREREKKKSQRKNLSLNISVTNFLDATLRLVSGRRERKEALACSHRALQIEFH